MVLDGNMIQQYCGMLPREIRLPAAALKDDRHWGVFLYLLEAGEQRFRDIGEVFDIKSNNDLDPILKTLVEGGLVRRFMKDTTQESDRRATWYQVTVLGQKYLELLEELILPQVLPGSDTHIPNHQQDMGKYREIKMKPPQYLKKVQLKPRYLQRA